MTRFLLNLAILLVGTPSALAVVNGYPIDAQKRAEVGLLVVLEAKPQSLVLSPSAAVERCTGFFISDYQMLTAGHCVQNTQGSRSIYLYQWKNNRAELVEPLEVRTRYIYEEIPDPVTNGPVPGCSPGLKPLPQTQTEDLALLIFPRNTAQKWFSLALQYTPQAGVKTEYYGFGSTQNPFISHFPMGTPTLEDLYVGSSELWRWNEQRIALLSPEDRSFAAPGDSGGPVLVDGTVVAVMSTISQKCDTEYGEDYAIQNTATLLSADKLKALGLPVSEIP